MSTSSGARVAVIGEAARPGRSGPEVIVYGHDGRALKVAHEGWDHLVESN